ncbi:MAG: DUF4382 domain-containing protein [Bacteroidales bacterium]|nr:DUF4382 domain-containing protein [Bacteroidales bacterium]
MKKRKLLPGIIAILGILFFAGCQDMENDGISDQNGKLVIKLTDAPFPIDMVEAATVDIVKVEIRKLSEGTELEYPFITLFENDTASFNLLELRNGVTADLLEIEIEPGNYDLIRLYVDQAGIVVTGGQEYSLKVPSGAQTGIKIFMEPALQVAGGLSTDVLLDFNVDSSFILKGNTQSPAGIKGFNFKPVIRAVNNTTAGTVAGVVINSDTAIHNASVWIEQEEVITTAYSDEEGYYAIPGLPAGLYTLSATFEGFDTVRVEGLEITAGNLTVQDFTLTRLEEPEE